MTLVLFLKRICENVDLFWGLTTSNTVYTEFTCYCIGSSKGRVWFRWGSQQLFKYYNSQKHGTTKHAPLDIISTANNEN